LVILTAGFECFDDASGVDVALDEVAAEAVAGAERAFEVDGGTRTEVAERGDGERLGQDIE
jgi:hypothetical protein